MHILQSGEAKSGNYWLYTIIEEIIDKAKIDKKSFIMSDPIYPIAKSWKLSTDNQVDENVMDISDSGCFYRISSIYRQPIENLEEYVRANTHVWTHSPYCSKSPKVFNHFDKVVYIIRDPRDVLFSMAKFNQTAYMRKFYPSKDEDIEQFVQNRFLKITRRWSINVAAQLKNIKHENVYVVFYEKLLTNLSEEIVKLLKYLNISLSNTEIEAIVAKVSFDSMKKNNPDHVNKAQLYGWQSKLDNKSNHQITRSIGQLLRDLNYPLNPNDKSLPELPKKGITFEAPTPIKGKKSLKMRLGMIKNALTP